MGQLLHMPSQTFVELLPQLRLGRAPDLELCLAPWEPRASWLHALLRWASEGWLLRDLGSRNGTAVNGRRLAPGQELLLGQGDQLAFGGPEGPWVLTDDGPPRPAARGPEGALIWGWEEGLLIHRGEEELLVRRRTDGGWVLGEEGREVQGGQAVELGGQTWILCLPEPISPTEGPPAERRRRRRSRTEGALQPGLSLHLSLSGPEPRRVAAALRWSDGAADLGQRAHHRLLWALAREREHGRRRQLPADEQGWLNLADLGAFLDLEAHPLYLWLCRLRAQLEASTGRSADLYIERAPTGELRLADLPVYLREMV